MSLSSNKQSVKVFCRLRPEKAKEKESGYKPCISVLSPGSLKISADGPTEDGNFDFTYDRVFDADSKQTEIFNYIAKPILDSALEGINGTIFCYGQTSSGKTHTMEGNYYSEEQKGIIPRMMEYIFEVIPNSSSDLEFTVKCSYLQIYNEKIQDLLDKEKTNLMVKEEKSKGVWVDEATDIYVSSKEEMFEVFQLGSQNRTVAATGMNEHSSRSHSLFIVTIFQKNSKTDSTKTGKLHFVDLAGSEKLSKTGIEGGQCLNEAKNINKSLMMLGMVINALTEGKSHVPYRDSKLTRVLQESLGGNSQTALIITCSMSSYNYSESLSTLRFGQRAKLIKNKVIANTERSAKELLLKLQEAEEKIKNYEVLIIQLQKGEEVILSEGISKTNSEVTNRQCQDCEKAMKKMLNQHIELVTLQEELEKTRQEKENLEDEMKTRSQEIYELNEKLILCDIKGKLLIDEEAKTFQELQLRLENFFLLSQKKIIHTDKVIALLEKMKYEVQVMCKSSQFRLSSDVDAGIEMYYCKLKSQFISTFTNHAMLVYQNSLFFAVPDERDNEFFLIRYKYALRHVEAQIDRSDPKLLLLIVVDKGKYLELAVLFDEISKANQVKNNLEEHRKASRSTEYLLLDSYFDDLSCNWKF